MVLSLTMLLPAQAQDLLDAFESSVTEFTLDNGLHFIIVERPEAPVVTFYTYADVGSVDEVKGITGMAHMFEHMAFKGTTTVGTNDIDGELAAMGRVDALYTDIKREEQQLNPDEARLAELREAFAAAQEEAQSYMASGEFDQAVERNGGTGMNASTFYDRTDYFYSLPANKAELWFSLESDRFLNPVLREFFIERDVIMEERRQRTESNPFGRLFEEFLSTAFKAHPYGEPVIGHMSDIQSYTRDEAEAFFQKYYGASNLTIAIVGAIEPAAAQEMAETYFGRLPAGEKPGPVETVEPPQLGERRVIIEEQSQPLLMMGWHKGSVNHPDDPVFEIMADILSTGRTSRFYTGLVEEQKALQAQALNSLAGFNKYPNLFFLFAVTSQGVEPTALEADITALIDEIKVNGVTEDELQRAKTRARANLVRELQSNSGVAGQLAYYQVVTGDWRNLFNRLDALEAVTNDDIMRVANETFTRRNRTVAMIQTAPPEMPAVGDASGDQ